MSTSLKKEKFHRGFYRCINFNKLLKNDGTPYIKLRLINSSEYIDGYLWSILDIYEKRISKGCVYAVKAIKENYNGISILNIRYINKITDQRYKIYNYTSEDISPSKKIVQNISFNGFIDSLTKYSNPLIQSIIEYYIKNKKIILKSDDVRYRTLCIKHLEMLSNENLIQDNIETAILVILIYKNNNINSIYSNKKGIKKEYQEMLLLQETNHKEFIKKYKYIVDLMEFNFLNMQTSNN